MFDLKITKVKAQMFWAKQLAENDPLFKQPRAKIDSKAWRVPRLLYRTSYVPLGLQDQSSHRKVTFHARNSREDNRVRDGMPKILSYTPAWLSRPSSGFDLFSSKVKSSTPSTSDFIGPRRTIARRGTEIFVVVDRVSFPCVCHYDGAYTAFYRL